MSWHQRLLLVSPRRVQERLDQLHGRVHPLPNLWQLELGALRMWHRAMFRSETIGTCTDYAVRSTWRARLLQFRPLRFPFLLAEKAIAPWDMTGLWSSRERVIRHLLGAHHDGHQFIYDLQMLEPHPGALQELAERLDAVLEGRDPRAEWLRDLCVYERYHEDLAQGLRRFLEGERELSAEDARDPDISFYAYLAWCAAQPTTPEATWRALRAGRFQLEQGLSPAAA